MAYVHMPTIHDANSILTEIPLEKGGGYVMAYQEGGQIVREVFYPLPAHVDRNDPVAVKQQLDVLYSQAMKESIACWRSRSKG